MFVGIYRPIGNIEDFSIKIQLSISSSVKSSSAPARSDIKDDVVINWQQKLFSKNQLDLCISSRDELPYPYQQFFENYKKTPTQCKRIFTYVQEEFNDLDRIDNQWVDNSVLEIIRLQTSAMADCRKTILLSESYSNRKAFMVIMANLSDHETRHEEIICIITYSSSGVLTLTPDFNFRRACYTFRYRGKIYSYKLIHCEQFTDIDCIIREEATFKKKLDTYRTYLQSLVSTTFHRVPTGNKLILLNGTIQSATSLNKNPIFVYYQLYLPIGWHAEMDDVHSGFTQTSNLRKKLAVFGYPIEFNVTSNNDCSGDIHKQSPCLMFKVFSIDRWKCVKIEGYGSWTIPLLSGSYLTDVNCWRLYKRKEELTFQLFGSTIDLKDLRYLVEFDSERGINSRFGLCTTSACRINLTMNVLVQNSCNAGEFESTEEKSGTIDNCIGNARSRLKDLIDAFDKAKSEIKSAQRDAKRILENNLLK